MKIGSLTEIGNVRRRNEDALLVDGEAGVFAVLDGLGGHPCGDLASGIGRDALQRVLDADAVRAAEDLGALLLAAVGEAHDAILRVAGERRDCRGMATTVVVIGVRGGAAWLVHVGDSRAYLLGPDGGLQQVTRDHGVGGYLSQALGLDGGIRPDLTTLDLPAGSRLLLCTDGLTNMVGADELARLLGSAADPQAASEALAAAALTAGGFDNITLVVVEP